MDYISYDNFSKLDLRVAKIVSTEKIPDKSRIIKGTISLGDEERDVIIGGAQFYEPEDLIGKTVIIFLPFLRILMIILMILDDSE